jgi:hypothetical protein
VIHLWHCRCKRQGIASGNDESVVAEIVQRMDWKLLEGRMPKGKRNMEGKARKPLIRIERVFYEKASFKLRTDVIGNIVEYAQYIKEMTGDEPTPDELVDRGMQRLFDADRGFRQWLQKKGGQDVSRVIGMKIEKLSEDVKQMSAGTSLES